MTDHLATTKLIYDRFNARDIAGVLAVVAADVVWANGMDGGHVHGREELRAYWTRQWSMVTPHVEPVALHEEGHGTVVVQVRQTVHDLEGRPLERQTHGLRSKTVEHVFSFRDGHVARFDLRDAEEPGREPR